MKIKYKSNNKKRVILMMGIILLSLIALGILGYSYIREDSVNLPATGKAVLEAGNSVYGSIAKIIGFSVDEAGEKIEETAPEPATELEVVEETAEETTPEHGIVEEPIAEETSELQDEEVNETETITLKKNITEEANITIPEQTVNLTIENITEEQEVNITEEANITIPEQTVNLTIENITKETNITIPEAINETIEETDITGINETITKEIIALNITTRQYRAVINRKVKWIKTFKADKTEAKNLTLEIPKQATNITVRTGQEVQEALNEIQDYEQTIEQADRQEIAETGIADGITGYVPLDIRESKGILTRLINWIKQLTITGKVIQENELQEEIIEKQDSKEIDLTNIIEQQEKQDEISVEYYTDAPISEEKIISRGKQVIISGPDELNYTDILAYTILDNKISINNSEKIKLYWLREETQSIEKEQAVAEPITDKTTEEQITNETTEIEENQTTEIINETEQPINNSSAELSNLTDIENSIVENKTKDKEQTSPITAFAVKEDIKDKEKHNKDNETEQPIDNSSAEPDNLTDIDNKIEELDVSQIIREEVNFTAYDLDEDGMIDYIEWEVLHLSNQTYEIIYISKGEHLDENYTFIEDVYEQVKEKDDNWTLIPDGDYIRVTFEKPLDKTKDIIIYARASNESSASVEVYRENDNQLLATFENITLDENKTFNEYKIFLTSLGDNESLSNFDLKVLGEAGIEFDYIVDPSLTFMAGSVLVTLNSPVNNSNFNVGNVTFNVTSNDTLNWCGVSINGLANVTMVNTTNKTFNSTNSSISDGSYNFIITCNDSAGTFGNSGLNRFLIDTIIPTINIFSPVNASTYSSSSILFNVSSSEEGSGSIIPDIDNSLVSWWRMDDTNGSANSVTDYMGRNNGTAVGNATQTDAGKLGKGFSFDGNGDYVDVGDNIDNQLSGSFSFSVWIKQSSSITNGGIIGLGDSSTRQIWLWDGGTKIQLQMGGLSATGGDAITLGQWYHMVGVFNGTTEQLYFNTVLKRTVSGTPHSYSSNNNFIGYLNGFSYFNGTIDDVMIFNRSLSADEILSIYNATKYQHTQTNLTEGAHTFKAYTQDLAGNMAMNGTIYFTTDTVYPSLVLLSPLNNSGDNDGNVSFVFNASDGDGNALNCSLIINDKVNLTNASVVNGANTSFDVAGLSFGSYNWSANCSDNAGNVNASSVWTLAVVSASEFSGRTTDLSAVNISNITNLVLDSPNYGKINFSENIDLSGGGDINSYVNVSFNRIEINISGLPALNKTARLTLYNLTYSNPRVLKDGSVCSDCSEVSYTSSTGTFVFDVTGFSVYSAEETPVATTPAADSGSSGGGGGSTLTKTIEDFSVDTEELKVRIVLNDVKEREIKIKNTGESNITIKASLEGEGMENVITFENNELLLGVGEEGVLKLDITAKELEIYTGKIILSSSRKTKEILVTINTQSKETLFDISLAIPESTISKDESLKAQVNLIPVGEKGVDVTLKYLIKDFKGKVYYEESETFYVDNQKSFAKEFKIDDLEYGSYILGVEMTYTGGFASTSSHFEIEENESSVTLIKEYYVYILILIILIIVVLFVVFEFRKMQKYKRYRE